MGARSVGKCLGAWSAARPVALLLPAVLALSGVVAQEEPAETDYRESVRVELVQTEVTVWPKNEEDAARCLDLTAADFELTVNGRAREIVAVDWLGASETMQLLEGQPIADPEHPPLTLVLFFDLWHLNVFHRRFNSCPMTKPLAFDKARELVEDEFRPGDRLLLVTFAGWPQIHGGWIRDPAHALSALNRLEVSPSVLSARRDHLHHADWIAGMKSLLLALGRYPGRKEIFYLGDDFRFDDVALQIFEMAARAQANRVAIHAVDLLESCRGQPGPGCPDMVDGGLGCTPFAQPIALGQISVNTGGGLFDDSDSLVEAVRTVRRMRGCRYLISFPMVKRDRKHAPTTIVRVKRKGLRLHFPSSFRSPRHEPTEREQQDALFLLPRFGQGIHAEIGLWPLRPSGKRKRWKGVMVARLRRAPEDPWPEELEKIEVEVVSHASSKIYGKFRKVVEGDQLVRLRDGESRLLAFPVDGIRPGANTAALRVVGVGGEVSANVRSSLDVPEPPGPGESGPWMLVDRLASVGDRVTVLPALDGVIASGRSSLILGFGCAGETARFGEGQLVAREGHAVVSVPIEWLDPLDGREPSGGECGWLVGRIEPTLGSGLWRFEPPSLSGPSDENPSAVEFRIAKPRESGNGE